MPGNRTVQATLADVRAAIDELAGHAYADIIPGLTQADFALAPPPAADPESEQAPEG